MTEVRVVVPVKEEILRAMERRKSADPQKQVADLLAELVDLGQEYRLQQLYRRFETGEISLGHFAQEMGLGVRELYAIREERGWPTSNITLPAIETEQTTGEE
jgi:hypothetical protein